MMAADIIDLLLSNSPKVPEKELRMDRLSEELGTDVVFKIRALSYNTVAKFVRGKDESELCIVLEGLVSPNLKDGRLLEKYKAATPMELLKTNNFLLPGEVAELALRIEQLSGYRANAFEEVIKN
jgi:hypothetical protein